jgi:hypothetical protein
MKFDKTPNGDGPSRLSSGKQNNNDDERFALENGTTAVAEIGSLALRASLVKLLTMMLLCSVSIAGAADVQVRAVRNKKDIAAPASAAFVTNIIELLRRSSVDSTAYAVKAETWQETLRSDSFVHVTFSLSRKLNVGREERTIDEILVPLPEGKWPAHIFAKSGTNVLAFTKYDARDLKRVALEPALELSLVPPYNSMTRFPDRNR